MNQRIGRYEIQSELGRGGFGRVFRAFDPTVGRPVAIKTLNATGEPDMLLRFRNEAAASGKLQHPNIIIVYDFGEQDGAPYLVMELLDGEDVERIVAHRRPLTILKRLDVMLQAAAGLHHAHLKGILHRDVKPANIMLQSNGIVKIMDFGIALVSQDTADRITPQGSLIGTLPYMAPEQFYGSGSSVITDIFAFGVTFYKLLTGVHPFQGPELGSMMNNIANQPHAPIRSHNAECPEALEQVINKLLSKPPESRYQNLEDLKFDLEPIVLELRKESIGDLLIEARDQIAADQLENAQSLIRQVIAVDPGNRVARELRDNIQRQVKERAVRPRITALVTSGRGQLSERKFDEAIQNFESALRLDQSNPELQRLLEQTRTAAERARRADQLLNQARQALHRDDLTGAHNSITEAVAADPEHAQAEALLVDVRQRMEVRDRLQAAIAHVKALLKDRRFTEAAGRLSQLQASFPDTAALRDLASYTAAELHAEKQADAIFRATAEARTMVASAQFDAALDLLQRVLADDPSLHPLRELMQSIASQKAARQRDTSLQQVLKEGAELSGRGKFSEILEHLDAYVRAYGESSALIPLRADAEKGLERQRQAASARKAMQNAQTLLDEGKPGPATEVLRKASIQFPDNSDLTSLRSVAEKSLREHRSAEAISQIISQAESMARAKRFAQALEVIDDGLRKYVGADRLLRCREAIVASQATRERGRRETSEPPKPAVEDATRVYPKTSITGPIDKGRSRAPDPTTRSGSSTRLFVAGGIGVATLGAGIALFHGWPSAPPAPPVAFTTVEIHSEPPGASVQLDDRSCITPDCRFELKPGQYHVEARLDGYQPLQRPLQVDPASGPRVVDLTLQPMPRIADTSTVATGRLVVRTGVPETLVYVDGAASGRTGQSGSLTVVLKAGQHEVRVERGGIQKAALQKVAIVKGGQQVLSFTLLPEPAKLELRNAPAGVEVRAGGKLLGRTDGSPVFVFAGPVNAGAQSLQLTLGPASRSVQQKFEAGQTLRLDWKDVAPGPSVDQTWNAVDQSNIDAVRRFVRENPDNPHARVEARKILEHFDAEQQRLAQERARLEQIRQDQIKQDQAKQEQARQEQIRQEQLRQDQLKQDQLKKDLARQAQLDQEKAKLERERMEQSRRAPVADTLQKLSSALQRKRRAEVKAIWPAISPTLFDSMNSGQVEMSMSIEDIQFPQGPDQAVAHCDLVTRTKVNNAAPVHHRGTVTLRNAGGNWTIETATFQ